MNCVTLRISDIPPAPEPSPLGTTTRTVASGAEKPLESVEDSANLSPVTRLATQALEADPQRVEALRLQFQSGQYTPDAYKTSEKMVEEHLDDPD